MDINAINNEELNLAFIADYDDESKPLAFLKLGDIPDSIQLELIRAFDLWYSSTNQDTPVWATEFARIVCELVNDGALAVNPLHLELAEVEEELFAIVGHISVEAEALYRKARSLSETDLVALWDEG